MRKRYPPEKRAFAVAQRGKMDSNTISKLIGVGERTVAYWLDAETPEGREKWREHNRRRRQKHAAPCDRCGKPASPGTKLCLACYSSRSEWNPPPKRALAFAMLDDPENTKTISAIARELGVPANTVYSWIKARSR